MGHAFPEGRPGGFRDEACLRPSSTSHSTMPRQPGRGLATNLNRVPTFGEKPSGCAPRPCAVHSGMSTGSVNARQTFVGGCRYSWTMWIALMALLGRERIRAVEAVKSVVRAVPNGRKRG